jgi:hypothetical protein
VKNLLLTKLVFSVLLTLLLHAPILQATSAQDIWLVPSENGWGMSVIQQDTSIGFAIYVYDQNQNPTWYLGSGSSSGSFVWSGQMYSYRGPYFGGFFNSSLVGANQVGTFSFTLNNVQTATLTYSINGVSVTKSLSRLSVGNDDLSGDYVGGLVGQDYSCSNAAYNLSGVNAGTLHISQSGSNVSLVTTTNGVSCTYSGTYSQTGRYGNIVGTYSCPTGESGNFNVFEIDSNSQGFTGRYTSSFTVSGVSCQGKGRVGGIYTAINF